MRDLALMLLTWWVAGLAVVSWFLTAIRRDEAPRVFYLIRMSRWSTVRFVLVEAWIWPGYALALLYLAIKRRG